MAIISTVYNLPNPHSDFYSQLPIPTTADGRRARALDQEELNMKLMRALAERYLGDANHPDSEAFFSEAALAGDGDLDEISAQYGKMVAFHASLTGKIKKPKGVPEQLVGRVQTQAQNGATILGTGLYDAEFPQQSREFI